MRRRLPFDITALVALFSICHFIGRYNAVFGHATKNSYVYSLVFLGFVIFIAVSSPVNQKMPSWTAKITAAIVIPYVASVFAYLFSYGLFIIEGIGKPAQWFEVLFITLFFPYIGSAAWTISAYVITWIFFDLYRVKKLSRPPENQCSANEKFLGHEDME